jgi:beta-glucosidase
MTAALAPYRDPARSVDERVADLLGRMTLDEKLAQVGAIWAFEFIGDEGVDDARLAGLAPHGIGHITRLAGSTNLLPPDVARAADAIQRHLLERTRLGIPALIHEECLHGLLAWGAPSFQQSIGAAATFDPPLTEAVAQTIGRRMLATGGRLALAPVLDITRDARWGRVEETYGEDPYLATALGLAYIRGLQGDDLAAGVAATAKHLVGHGLAEGGMNQAPAHVGTRELRDEHLLPFEAAIRETALAAVMPAYCDVDGVPCHASPDLLDRIVRREWGFDGLVVSDYMGIAMVHSAHRLTAELGDAAGLALTAGVDAELPRIDAYGEPLRAALADGRVPLAALDAAVANVLRMKLRLGLFERPYVGDLTVPWLQALEADEARLGRELATRSMVLVENDGILPLRPGLGRVAVVGPNADSARDLLGDYSHLVHMQTLREARSGIDALGIVAHDGRDPDDGSLPVDRRDGHPTGAPEPLDELAGHGTILTALRERLGRDVVVHARGTGLRDGSVADLRAAVEAARGADVAIVVLGERSGLTDDATTGEFRDRLDLGFLGRQSELLDAIVATGTPTVLVVVSGRPLALGPGADRCAAILLAWVPGDHGPDALADVLTGVAEPGGRLPISMPRHVGQVPLTYRHHPTGGRSHPKGEYVDGPTTPRWPFGHGRGYTCFRLSALRLDRTEVPTRDGELRVSVDVENVGEREGDEVVQLYLRDEEASVARPVIQLAGFQRVRLRPGACRTVTFSVSVEQLAYTGIDHRRVIEPGRVTVSVGTSSADRPLDTTVRLVGPVVALPERRRFITQATVSPPD